MVTIAVPQNNSADPLVCIDRTGVRESARGFETWWRNNVPNGTAANPTIVTLQANQRLNLTNLVDLGVKNYVIFATANPSAGRAKLESKDGYPYKVLDKWGRIGVWDAGDASTLSTFRFSGPDKNGVAHPDGDGSGLTAPGVGPYTVGFADENGFANGDPFGEVGPWDKIDPDAASWVPAAYQNKKAGLFVHNLNGGAKTLKLRPGSLRCKFQHLLIEGANKGIAHVKFNFAANFPFVNEGQCLLDMEDTVDCAVVDTEVRYAHCDTLNAGADKIWVGRSKVWGAGRDVTILRRAYNVVFEDTILARGGAQVIDNEPATRRPYFTGALAQLDGLWLKNVTFGGWKANDPSQGLFISNQDGDTMHVCLDNVHSTQADVDAGDIDYLGPILSGSTPMGPTSGGGTTLPSPWVNLIRGSFIFRDIVEDLQTEKCWGRFQNVKNLYVDNVQANIVGPSAFTCNQSGTVSSPTDGGLRLTERQQNFKVETNCDFGSGVADYRYCWGLRSQWTGTFIPPGTSGTGDLWWTNDAPIPALYWRDNDVPVGADTLAPAQPQNLNAVAAPGAVSLTWSAVTTNADASPCTDLDRYQLARFGTFNVVELTGTSYTWPGLTPGVSYSFQVRAVDDSGNFSAWSTADSATPTSTAVAPAAPQNIVATVGGAPGRVDLTWDDDANADSWLVSQQNANGTWAAPSSVVAPAKIYTGLTDGTLYAWRIQAVNGFGTSPFSEIIQATPVDLIEPSAPTGVVANPSIGGLTGGVNIFWDANTEPDLSHYALFKRNPIGSVPLWPGFHVRIDPPYRSFDWEPLPFDVPQTFRVVAVDTSDNISPYSAEVTATPTADVVVPDPPENLAGSPQDHRVVLTWDDDPAAASWEAFILESDGVTWRRFRTPTTPVATATFLQNGTEYTFRVTALNGAGSSTPSAQVSETPSANIVVSPPPDPAEPPPFLSAPVDTWLVVARRPDLRAEGLVEYSSFEFVARYNAPGSFVIDVVWDGDPNSPAGRLREPGWGVMLFLNGELVFSGPVTTAPVHFDESLYQLTASGTDDLGQLGRRVVRPVPTVAAPPYNADAYDVFGGFGEEIIKHFVDVNAGPGAISTMRIPGLAIESNHNRGTARIEQGRWENLLEIIERVATVDSLGYRIFQDGQTLNFEVYESEDKTRSVVFGVELGNVGAYDYAVEEPSANHVVVLGGGEGVARQVVEVEDVGSIDAWGRRVKTRDARDVDPSDPNAATILTQRGDEELANGKAKYSFAATVNSTDQLQWFPIARARAPKPTRLPLDTHTLMSEHVPLSGLFNLLATLVATFDLGDLVSFLIDHVRVFEVIREIHVRVDGDGMLVRPIVGTPDYGDPHMAFINSLLKPARDLDRRVKTLERTR